MERRREGDLKGPSPSPAGAYHVQSSCEKGGAKTREGGVGGVADGVESPP